MKPEIWQSYAEAKDAHSHGKHMVIYIGADWCGPCRQMKPNLEKVLSEHPGAFAACKLDLDRNQAECTEVGNINAVPTVVLKKGDKEDRLVGLRSISDIAKFLGVK